MYGVNIVMIDQTGGPLKDRPHLTVTSGVAVGPTDKTVAL